MFKNALKQLMATLVHRKSVVPQDGHIDIYGRAVEAGDDFFHPKKFRGIPVFDVKSILNHYQPQLDKIRKHVEIGDQRKTPDGKSLYDAIYTSVIERYVEFCHMIPASEDHHHSHAGGLLLHSLEASVESLRWAKEKQCGSSGFVDIDAKVKPVMNYCAWLAALLHDAGKMMRDISVDAVEVYNPKTRQQGPVTESILSWHPAKESLIEWAKRHNVASYSVNFLSHRTHNRHNVDSSQILQPLLRNHYAMDYLFSTPIKQEVYSALTSVLSGYSTSDNFLSEAVRMGDSASTSRSLGYLYDSKLGTREISTAQRLYRSIRHAAKDWRWNELNGHGWIIGGAVFIRWSSTVEDIIKVSQALGYSLPIDVKNVLNIMQSNNITELFDNTSADDRIVRFTPGEFTHQEMLDIQRGKKQMRWLDLLKLRGPEVIFAESPMPFSRSGLFYLPKADVFYSITKGGALTKLPAVFEKAEVLAIKENSTPPSVESDSHIDNNQTQIKQVNDSKSKKIDSKPKATANIEVMPSTNNPNKGLSGICFSNKPNIQSVSSSAPKQAPVKTSTNCNSGNPYSKALQSIFASSPTFTMVGDHAIISTADIPLTEGEALKDILSMLEKSNELEINLNYPNIKTMMRIIGDEKQKCIKLSKRASAYFKNNAPLTQAQPNKTKVKVRKGMTTSEAVNVDKYITGNTDNQIQLPISVKNNNLKTSSSENSDLQASQDVYTPAHINLRDVVGVSTTFTLENKIYLNIDVAVACSEASEAVILHFLNKEGYMEVLDNKSPDDSLINLTYKGQPIRAALLSQECIRKRFSENDVVKVDNPDVPISYKKSLSLESEISDTQQLDYLVKISNVGSLLKYLSTQDCLDSITENGIDGFYLNTSKINDGISKKLNLTRLRAYMSDKKFPYSDKGYLLSANELSKIQMSEVSFND
jgi:hypothetical protein